MLKTRRGSRKETVIETIDNCNKSRGYLLLGHHVASDVIADEVGGVLCWGSSASVSGSRTSSFGGWICFSHCTYNLVVVFYLIIIKKKTLPFLISGLD